MIVDSPGRSVCVGIQDVCMYNSWYEPLSFASALSHYVAVLLLADRRLAAMYELSAD